MLDLNLIIGQQLVLLQQMVNHLLEEVQRVSCHQFMEEQFRMLQKES